MLPFLSPCQQGFAVIFAGKRAAVAAIAGGARK